MSVIGVFVGVVVVVAAVVCDRMRREKERERVSKIDRYVPCHSLLESSPARRRE